MVELPEWVRQRLHAPEATRAARESWLDARELGGRPDLEWAFPVNIFRGFAVRDPVLYDFYEPLSHWDEVTLALGVRNLLLQEGVAEYLAVAVGLGVEVFESAYHAAQGRLSPPVAGEPFRGRHWVWALGDIDDDTLAFGNTWGPDWGDRGSGYLTRDYFEAHVDHALAARPVFTGMSPAMDGKLRDRLWQTGQPRGTDLKLWAQAWKEPNPRQMGSVNLNGRTFQRWRRVVFALRSGWPPTHVYDLVEDGRSSAVSIWYTSATVQRLYFKSFGCPLACGV